MKIYKLEPHNSYETLFSKYENKYFSADCFFEGKSVIKNWETLETEFNENNKKLKKIGDFMNISNLDGISEIAADIYEKHIREDVELLPLNSPTKKKYFIMNVLSVIDALDVENSDVKYFKCEPDRIMNVDRYVFKEEEIGKHLIFKLKQFPRSYIFVTEEFVKIAQENKLKGFSARLVWDSENPDSEDIGKCVEVG